MMTYFLVTVSSRQDRLRPSSHPLIASELRNLMMLLIRVLEAKKSNLQETNSLVLYHLIKKKTIQGSLNFCSLNSESDAQAMTTELNRQEKAQSKRKGNGIQSIDKIQDHKNGLTFSG